jgi:hypothetical protein
MLDQQFPTDIFGPLEGTERVLWRGRAGVAEYAFDRAASMPQWTLPESTHVLVTDRRVVYAQASGDREVTSGELRWIWPQYLRLQPGARSRDRGAAATHIQLVCGATDGSYPALVFAGGDLKTVAHADKLANVLRQAIARFRVDHAADLGLTTPQARMLSRLVIGPEFANYQGGEGQTVALSGALLVSRPRPPAPRAEPAPIAPVDAGTRVLIQRPGIDADAQRAWQAAQAEEATQQARPEVASRVADLAARVADLVSHEPIALSEMDTVGDDVPPRTLARSSASRCAVRASRFTANSGAAARGPPGQSRRPVIPRATRPRLTHPPPLRSWSCMVGHMPV